jgi:quercetin dioxygenase-like cupin family protein
VDPVVSKPGDGERFERENRTLTIRVDLPGVSIIEIEFDDTFSVDPHTHDDHVDSFYVLDGEVEFTVGDHTVRAGPGTVLSAPAGARHGFRSAGGTARVLNIHAPDAGFAHSIRNYKP